jgi:hypothetical protein
VQRATIEHLGEGGFLFNGWEGTCERLKREVKLREVGVHLLDEADDTAEVLGVSDHAVIWVGKYLTK